MAAQKNISTFGDVFKRGYQVVKHNKFLWFFGFFAAFLGAGGEFESLLKNYSSITDTSNQIFSWESFLRAGLLGSFISNIGSLFSSYPFQSILVLLLIVLIGLLLLLLANVSQIALFSTASKYSKNQKVTFREAWREGYKYIGSVLVINIIVKVVLYVLFILIAVPLVSWFILHNSTLAGVIFVIVIFFVFIPLSIIISFIIKYAIAYIVIEGKKAWEGVRLGWQLFLANWLVSLEMALIVLLIGVSVGLVMMVVIGLAAIPFILIGIAMLFFDSVVGFAVVVVIATILFIVIGAFMGSMYVAYQYSAWTLLFQKLVEEKAQSKIMRFFNKIIPAKT
jgi:hypothetical protein